MNLVIATHNTGKIHDFEHILVPLSGGEITIFTLADLKITDQPEETAPTFETNARLKAMYYAKRAKMPALSDDGGLRIDALDGAPGIKSHRWVGHEAEDEELIAYTLTRMEGIPPEKRSANLSTCLCFFDPATGFTAYAEGRVNGHITEKANEHWTRGYPYRAVFRVDQFNKYYDELTPQEHEQINHRVKALREIWEQIDAYRKNMSA